MPFLQGKKKNEMVLFNQVLRRPLLKQMDCLDLYDHKTIPR